MPKLYPSARTDGGLALPAHASQSQAPSRFRMSSALPQQTSAAAADPPHFRPNPVLESAFGAKQKQKQPQQSQPQSQAASPRRAPGDVSEYYTAGAEAGVATTAFPARRKGRGEAAAVDLGPSVALGGRSRLSQPEVQPPAAAKARPSEPAGDTTVGFDPLLSVIAHTIRRTGTHKKAKPTAAPPRAVRDG